MFLTLQLGKVKKAKNEHFENVFFLCSLAPEKRIYYDSHSTYRHVLTWYNAKTPRVDLMGLPNNWCCVYIHFFLFFYFLFFIFLFFGVLGRFLMTSLALKLHVMETSTPLWYLLEIWSQLDVRYTFRVLLYLWDVKKFFIGNWAVVYILAVMGQYTFSILFVCTTFSFVCFLEEKIFPVYFFFIWLAAMGHHTHWWRAFEKSRGKFSFMFLCIFDDL